MKSDPSNGYEAIAQEYLSHRSKSTLGTGIVRLWARTLAAEASILDLGCGNGIPVTEVLARDGFTLYGIDASPSMVKSYREHFPGLTVACEPVEKSDYFGRKFDGVVAWGLMFLLPESEQSELIHRISAILKPGGQFLFTSPEAVCTWTDIMTGLESRSLGAEKYKGLLSGAGLSIVAQHMDEGENHYYFAKKQTIRMH